MVGGAVRDKLLRRPAKDADWLAVGATEAELVARWPGATRVGKAFPVYLVDGLGEVALARRESKRGRGHSGFSVEFGPEVTLEDDLSRRDLTVNAMVLDERGNLLDFFGGAADLERRVLRHVGPAFPDDPLRAYRLARFAAELDFDVASETVEVCRVIPRDELADEPRDRVRVEFMRAMAGPAPQRFVRVLRDAGLLDVHFKEVDDLALVPAGPESHHGEGDALTHTLMVLREAARISGEAAVRVAALTHDLGKALTPRHLLPRHLGHEEAGVELVRGLCERLGLSKQLQSACCLFAREHLNVHRFSSLRDVRKVDVVTAADRCILKAEGVADAAEADALGRTPPGGIVGSTLLRLAAKAAREAEVEPIPERLIGEERGLYVRARRAEAVRRALASQTE